MALESKSKPEDYEMDYDLTTEMIYAKMASVADESTAADMLNSFTLRVRVRTSV